MMYTKKPLNVMTLNINGLNCKKKQQLLYDFIKENNLNIVNLLEHNLKNGHNLLDIFFMSIFM